ncbi:hypothetical protein B0H14DRAFT_1058193 [Mycena olivaceomarginata]|nr:hypothetical protein B0H14DRAFT_1058193 [Mycena olivaceomarginata]
MRLAGAARPAAWMIEILGSADLKQPHPSQLFAPPTTLCDAAASLQVLSHRQTPHGSRSRRPCDRARHRRHRGAGLNWTRLPLWAMNYIVRLFGWAQKSTIGSLYGSTYTRRWGHRLVIRKRYWNASAAIPNAPKKSRDRFFVQSFVDDKGF